jgi:peroxiredoxin
MNLGETVSDVQLQRLDGTVCTLAEFTGRKVLLIFLRHLT